MPSYLGECGAYPLQSGSRSAAVDVEGACGLRQWICLCGDMRLCLCSHAAFGPLRTFHWHCCPKGILDQEKEYHRENRRWGLLGRVFLCGDGWRSGSPGVWNILVVRGTVGPASVILRGLVLLHFWTRIHHMTQQHWSTALLTFNIRLIKSTLKSVSTHLLFIPMRIHTSIWKTNVEEIIATTQDKLPQGRNKFGHVWNDDIKTRKCARHGSNVHDEIL